MIFNALHPCLRIVNGIKLFILHILHVRNFTCNFTCKNVLGPHPSNFWETPPPRISKPTTGCSPISAQQWYVWFLMKIKITCSKVTSIGVEHWNVKNFLFTCKVLSTVFRLQLSQYSRYDHGYGDENVLCIILHHGEVWSKSETHVLGTFLLTHEVWPLIAYHLFVW